MGIGKKACWAAALCTALTSCGKTKHDTESADTGTGGLSGSSTRSASASAGGSLSSGPAGVTTVGVGTFGSGVGGMGNGGSGGDESGSGGSGGGVGEVWGWPLDESARCLEGERHRFFAVGYCGQAPSVRRDGDGRCWWLEGFCDVEGLTVDRSCGSAEPDMPEPCGEGGQGGQAGGSP